MNERAQLRQRIQAAREDAMAALAALRTTTAGSGRDLFKQVTGHSSVDNAVAEAQRIIDAYDRMLADLESDPQSAQVAIHVLGAIGGRAVVA